LDAKQNCLSKTTLKTVFVSKCEAEILIPPDGAKDANINVGTTVSIDVPDDVATPEKDFTVSIIIEVKGTVNEDDDLDEEIVFTVNSTLVGVFSVKSGEMHIEDIKKCAGMFSVQLFPVLRQHLVHTLLDMSVSSTQAPWDIGLGALSELSALNETSE